jgi:hypothetical protein
MKRKTAQYKIYLKNTLISRFIFNQKPPKNMKKMPFNLRYIVAITCFFGLLWAGCKYENGPLVSIYSAEFRLVRAWKFKSVYYNNVDISLGLRDSFDYTSSSLGFSKGGTFAFLTNDLHQGSRKGTQIYSGKWSFKNEEKELVLAFDDSRLGNITYRITQLTEKVLWYKLNDTEYRLALPK